jgi:membrane-associated protease RseP (regulator of RpoE activity)
MALDDDADDLPSGPPPPPDKRAWRHPSELGLLAEQSERRSPRRRTGWLLAAAAATASLLALVIVGVIREVGSPSGVAVDRSPATQNTDVEPPSQPSVRGAAAWLGVDGADVPDRTGAVVVSVSERSPAAAAGLVAGDLIIAVDGRAIASFADLQVVVAEHDAGDVVVLEVMRATVRLEVRCVFGEQPADG